MIEETEKLRLTNHGSLFSTKEFLRDRDLQTVLTDVPETGTIR